MNTDLPDIIGSTYGTATKTTSMLTGLTTNAIYKQDDMEMNRVNEIINSMTKAQASKQSENNTMSKRRLIQVFIVDPNEQVPLTDAILYQGEVHLTDLTDEELFFEIPVKELLAAHNEKREKIVDKKIKERTEYLEPAKIRNLKMSVVTLADF